ncbi:MAG: molybdate ABC transporter substrate-binding protein [Campylobacterales bacterium]|nr:molybdate ABC transporter substrate-binding protein [Campylobacterales bacterium]
MFTKVLLLGIILSSFVLSSSDFKIACVAGYKKPIQEVLKAFEIQKGIKIDALYGNMQQSIAHVLNSDIALIIGDKKYLSTNSKLTISNYTLLGYGKVIVAFAKGVETKNKIEDLLDPKITKIAMPQPQKAIYGIAGEEFLKNAKLYNTLKPKLYLVATIPQVSAYLMTQEVEAGILNITAYLANKEKFSGYIEVDSNLYTPIEIVAAQLKCQNKACQEFVAFLESNDAKKILKEHGL